MVACASIIRNRWKWIIVKFDWSILKDENKIQPKEQGFPLRLLNNGTRTHVHPYTSHSTTASLSLPPLNKRWYFRKAAISSYGFSTLLWRSLLNRCHLIRMSLPPPSDTLILSFAVFSVYLNGACSSKNTEYPVSSTPKSNKTWVNHTEECGCLLTLR